MALRAFVRRGVAVSFGEFAIVELAIYEFKKGNAFLGVRDNVPMDGSARSLYAGPLDHICDEKSFV